MNSFEQHIKSYLDSQRDCLITDAMSYALEGGKRFRPRVICSILKGFGIPENTGYDAALALELIQTYSLIHDDLPAMDDDDMRRGKPSLHKAFREDIAILAGDQLLTDAFKVISDSPSYDDSAKVRMISALSRYAGLDGMIYGQLLDVTTDEDSINRDKLIEIQENKTAGLFKIACLMPMYIAGIDDEDYFVGLGSRIGQIFQNQDDLFDIIKTEEEMGKNLSDRKNRKGTALTVYTLEELQELIGRMFDDLETYLSKAPFDPSELKLLLEKLKNR